jgi:teichuronic acid biosynthesis glycosyltransferase TuaG
MISILMPIYNGGEFMKESIPSILYQSFTQWELIIGINGHAPSSTLYKEACLWSDDSRIKVYDMSTKGKSDTLNEMLSYCSYDWVALLDVDDKWLPKKLESQIPFMKDYDVIGTHCQYFGGLTNRPVIPFGVRR